MLNARRMVLPLAVATMIVVSAPPVHARQWSLGRSGQGRSITAFETGTPTSPVKVLVIGCIHGDECAGRAITRQLRMIGASADLDLWIVPNLNPDGFAAHTRQNAHGVDLNRNFPWHWRVLGPPGDPEYAGTHALSERESRIALRLIRRVQPDLTIWYHQDLRVVDESGGSVAIERRYARLVGLPLRRLPRYHGSATTWQNHRFPGSTAFVVELPAGTLGNRSALRHARAVIDAARRLRSG